MHGYIHTKINEPKSNLAFGKKKPYGILCLSYKHTMKWGGGNPCQESLINLIWIVIALVWLNQMATVTQWLQCRRYTLHSIRCQEKHKNGHGHERN